MKPELMPMLPKLDEVDSVCEICSRIHGNAELRQELTSVYEAMEMEYATSRLDLVMTKVQSTSSLPILP